MIAWVIINKSHSDFRLRTPIFKIKDNYFRRAPERNL